MDETLPQEPQGQTTLEPTEDTGAPKKKYKVGKLTGTLMIGTAIVFDLISIIPVVGNFLALAGVIVVFGIWFLIVGIPILGTRQLITQALTYATELIPALSVLPAYTAGIILMIVFTAVQEKTGVDVLGAVSKIKNPTQTSTITQAVRPSMNDMLSSAS